ncbi:MAG: inositol monophosphatase family protein [Mycobacteriaceae bacterium]
MQNLESSSTIDAQHLQSVAVKLADEAAGLARQRRDQVFDPNDPSAAFSGPAISTKSTRTDPVTVVDREVEQLLRRRLSQLRPEDNVFGEEGGGDAEETSGLRWVLDPIDGTVNFMYGIPAFAVSVAVQKDGVSIAGAVADIAARQIYAAARGCGSVVINSSGTSTSLSCNPIVDPQLALVATGFGYESELRRVQGQLVAKILPRVRDIRRVGSAALDLCMVASGRVDAHFEHGLSPWDWAAGSLIASEAGAIVHLPEPDSTSVQGRALVAMAPGVAIELGKIFEELGVYHSIPL